MAALLRLCLLAAAALRPAAAAFSATPAALLDQFDPDGGPVRARDGAVPGYAFSWKLNAAAARITGALCPSPMTMKWNPGQRRRIRSATATMNSGFLSG